MLNFDSNAFDCRADMYFYSNIFDVFSLHVLLPHTSFYYIFVMIVFKLIKQLLH